MKYNYRIEINAPSSRGTTIEYRYGNIRRIQMQIGKHGALISFDTNKLRESDRLLTEDDALVMDAVKKACLMFALINGVGLDIRQVVIRLNDVPIRSDAFDKTHPLVYSMLIGNLGINGDELDDPALLTQIANTPKSKYGRSEAALMAYLVAKTRTYRIERFIYLWMAVNAVYALAMEEARGFMKTSTGKETTRTTEKDGLRLISAIYNMKYPVIHKENEKRVLAHAFSLAKRMDIQECLSVLDSTVRGERKSEDNHDRYEVKEKEFEEYDWLALMVFWLPYNLRCHFFHSESTVPVFCYEDEKLLQGLAFVNTLLERFLSLELTKWVTTEKREAALKNKIQTTAASMVFGS